MYGQYSVYVVQIHFEFQIFSAIVSVYLTRWRSIRYYCSSASKFLVQIENWIYCDVWTIFSPRCTNTLWISNFHCNCISIFNSMISIRYYCSSNSIFFVEFENYIYFDVWTIFTHILQIHFKFQIFIDIVSIWFLSMKIYQILVQLQLKPLSSNWKLNTMWCMDNIQSTLYKYTLNFIFSLQLYLYI